MRDVEQKLADFDAFADDAVDYLIALLNDYRKPLIDLARGRQVEGHFRYGDKLMYEYTAAELDAETAQELADAIVYVSRKLGM